MADHEKILSDLGFTEDADHKALTEQVAVESGADKNGPYVVHGAWSKGDIKVHLEQNTAPDQDGEMTAQITHPPVLVVEKAGKRVVALSPRDAESLPDILKTV